MSLLNKGIVFRDVPGGGWHCNDCGQDIHHDLRHSHKFSGSKATRVRPEAEHRTNTEPRSELAQGSTDPKDNLPEELVNEIWTNAMSSQSARNVERMVREYVTLAQHLHEYEGSICKYCGVPFKQLLTNTQRLQRDSQPDVLAPARSDVRNKDNLGKGEPSA